MNLEKKENVFICKKRSIMTMILYKKLFLLLKVKEEMLRVYKIDEIL